MANRRDFIFGSRRRIMLEWIHPYINYVEFEGFLSFWSWNVMIQAS